MNIRKLLFVLSFCVSAISFAQVGVGTSTPNASAQLDVVATDKGVLLPRVALTGANDDGTISNGNVVGLIVYNTATTADVKPGYYYWNGDGWTSLGGDPETTVTDGTGTPTDENPADPKAGDIYVDASTGDIYTYNGTTWVNKSKVVSADTNNVIVEGTDKLAFLDADKIKTAIGVSTGTGAPTAVSPADAAAGDIYVDESTGDVYTNNGTKWVKVGSGDGPDTTVGTGAPTDENPAEPAAGDLYVDESTGECRLIFVQQRPLVHGIVCAKLVGDHALR
jgi:hypothetical protein